MSYQTIRRLYSDLSVFLSNVTDSARFSLAAAFVAAVGWLGICFLLHHAAGVSGLVLAGGLILFGINLYVLVIIRKLNALIKRRVYDERSMQAMAGIYLALKPEIPLPYFRSAALSTDSCLDYIRLIKQVHPKTILELGSGSSTVVAGYQLKINGEGRVIALDHDEQWGELTGQSLLEHDLVDVAEVRIASLKSVKLAGHKYQWYDLSKLEDITSIDILLIDGPPDPSDFGFRYPGLALLSERVSEGGVILVDDCVMPRWNKTVLSWANEHGFTVESRFLNEKNTLFLRRQRNGVDRHKC